MRSLKLAGAMILPALALFLTGCASPPDTGAAMASNQDKAIKDPMSYSPSMDSTDITGGGFGSYDNNGMTKDLNDVFNP